MWLLLACADPPDSEPPAPKLDPRVVESLSMTEIRDDVDLLASDDLAGRAPGSPGHDFARDWLAEQLLDAGLEPVGDDVIVPVDLHLSRPRLALDPDGAIYEIPLDQVGVDLLAVRPGSDPALSDEVVLLMAHYDHLGVDETGAAYNGAFDDAAAVCALLELARALDRFDVRFPRTVAFLFTDAEEDGMDGAAAWATAPSLDVAAAISVDPIGRPVLTDFRPLFTIGAERSPELTAAVKAVGDPVRRLSDTPVVGYFSDQQVFWDLGVPALWVSSGGMTFYHQTSDDPDTIDYRSVQEHLGAIARLVAEVASGPRPTDLGPQPIRADDLTEAVAVLDGALQSAELTDDERATGDQFRETLARGASSADPNAAEFALAYASLLLYVIDDLTPAHPGPIPPPFPD